MAYPAISQLDYYYSKKKIHAFNPSKAIEIFKPCIRDVLRDINRNTIHRVCRNLKSSCQKYDVQNEEHFQLCT